MTDETRALIEQERNNPSVSVEPVATGKVLNDAVMESVRDGKKDIKELARDITYVKNASDLQDNETFKSQYQTELGKQLVEDLKDEGKRAAIREKSKKIEAKNIRNEAFYLGYKPIFSLLGIEAAFGYVPMLITVILLMIPFLLVSFVRFVINAINEMFIAIGGFEKPAKLICKIVIFSALGISVILALLGLIDAFFHTNIFTRAENMLLTLGN